MTELYNVREAAKVFGIGESKVRYWLQTGLLAASVRQGGRPYFTFRDLCVMKVAADLTAHSAKNEVVRKHVDMISKQLPPTLDKSHQGRVISDGNSLFILADDRPFESSIGTIVLAFSLQSLRENIEDSLSDKEFGDDVELRANGVPERVVQDKTDVMTSGSAYGFFSQALEAEDAGDLITAEHLYRQALAMQPGFTAAIVNLGNLRHGCGEFSEARRLYEKALAVEPTLAEARFNLANVLEDIGELEHAASELRRVLLQNPDYADAHYNLGLLLARLGSTNQANRALDRYSELTGEQRPVIIARTKRSDRSVQIATNDSAATNAI